ncbi:MAG: hypothetical protein II999_08890 [Bacteroidaceae bacterium]|nr:hypothetical protein [Bacteroidaceae bacterium]
MTETNRIEYKRELTSELDIEKEVVAFLNITELLEQNHIESNCIEY